MKPLISILSDAECDDLISRTGTTMRSGRCCPRQCGIDRHLSKVPCGGLSDLIKVASFHPHKGEEPPVSGANGAGNVFFSGCTLSCVFCQNFPFSHYHNGTEYSLEDFREKILALIGKGVHNLNLTTFDHYVNPVLRALLPIRREINVPIANNCAGYFAEETLRAALSFCDIFLYDVKYTDNVIAERYSRIKNYAEACWNGVSILSSEKIPFYEEDGLLKRGVIFRHLVIPGAVGNSIAVLDRLAAIRDGGFDFRVSVMSQYFPAHRAHEFPEIDRRLTEDEYAAVCERVDELGFEGWVQELEGEGGC